MERMTVTDLIASLLIVRENKEDVIQNMSEDEIDRMYIEHGFVPPSIKSLMTLEPKKQMTRRDRRSRRRHLPPKKT
jgi:hypothetical protein